MNLTDEIKEKLKNAKSEEEARTIINSIREGTEGADIILDDDDLDKVAGGSNWWKEFWEWIKDPSYYEKNYIRNQ